jgi:acetylornithine deacetylase
VAQIVTMFLLRSLVFLCLSCVFVRAEQAPLLFNGKDGVKFGGDSPTASKFSTTDLLDLHKRLIEIESITDNEEDVGTWLASYLSEAGLTVEKQEVAKDRYNIFAYPSPKLRATKILVTSHIDTVPPFWPYELKNNGTEIWGRGSVDAKACVAAQTIAVLDLLDKEEVKNEEVALLFVVGEERTGDGMLHFSSHKPTNYTAVVFGEPTEGKLAAGHKGILGWKIKVKGKASHSGYPSLGLSANNILIEALDELLWLEKYLPASEKYGNSTLNVGRISGGVAANVVAETAEADLALRIANGSVKAISLMVRNQLSPLIARAEEAGGELSVEWTTEGYGVVDLDHDIEGFDEITVNYGTDVPNLEGDHKKYLYGPGSILVAHSDHEHLKVSELERAVEDYQKIILAVLDKDLKSR